MGPDRRAVCLRCAQIKQACDGSVPCSRCVRLALTCRPRKHPGCRSGRSNRSAGGSNSVQGDDDCCDEVQKPKARIRRVQTGCVMCKRRKKKCDEVKPQCGDCRRLSLECVWPLAKSAPFSGASTQAASCAYSPEPSQQVSVMTMGLSLDSLGSGLDYTAESDRTNHEMNLSALSLCADSPKSSVASSARELIKPMHVRLDDSLESVRMSHYDFQSSYCSDATPETSWLEARAYNAVDTTTSHFTSSDFVSLILPQLISAVDRALLNHFAQVVSVVLCRHPSQINPFKHFFLFYAHKDQLFLHCILALAGKHWGKTQPAMGSRGTEHQSKAQQALAQLATQSDKETLSIALACSLVLCMTEFLDGTSQGWQVHMLGAKRLLEVASAETPEVKTDGCTFLFRLLRFLDLTATVATCMPSRTVGDETQSRSKMPAVLSTKKDAALYGIPKELFYLFDRVNGLAEKRKYRVDSASEAKFREDAEELREMIDEWSYEYARLTEQAGHADGYVTPTSDIFRATTAYEHAVRLRLHQVVDGYNMHDGDAVSHVYTILEAVQDVRYGSPLEACLVYPLVMAGGACKCLEERAIVLNRLVIMERTIGFGYVYNARELVERVWARRDEMGGEATEAGVMVNWAQVRYEEMHGLVVF